MTAAPGFAPPGIAPPVPSLAPAVGEAQRQQAAALLQHTYRWMADALPGAPQLSAFVPPTVTAAQLYAAQQYAACIRQITAVIGALQNARAAFPTLPPL